MPGDGSLMSKNKGSRFEEESKRARISFDPKKFLAKVGDGKTIAEYHKDQFVFAQGDVAEAVFQGLVFFGLRRDPTHQMQF